MQLLFVCTHNRCRSILAEAISKHVAAEFITARSAGSSPAGEVHPLTLRYLGERGIDTAGLHSKGWDTLGGPAPDIVVTVCDRAAGEACPLWLGSAEKVHWGLADPSAVEGTEAEQRAAFMHSIDTIEQRLRATLGALAALDSRQQASRVAQLAAAMRDMASAH